MCPVDVYSKLTTPLHPPEDLPWSGRGQDTAGGDPGMLLSVVPLRAMRAEHYSCGPSTSHQVAYKAKKKKTKSASGPCIGPSDFGSGTNIRRGPGQPRRGGRGRLFFFLKIHYLLWLA